MSNYVHESYRNKRKNRCQTESKRHSNLLNDISTDRELVWSPSLPAPRPYWPFWRIEVDTSLVYLTQNGTLYTAPEGARMPPFGGAESSFVVPFGREDPGKLRWAALPSIPPGPGLELCSNSKYKLRHPKGHRPG